MQKVAQAATASCAAGRTVPHTRFPRIFAVGCSVADPGSFPPAYVAPALAFAVALKAMAIWWFYGERPTRMEPQLYRPMPVLPAPLQYPSPATVQEPGQAETTASRAVDPPLQRRQAGAGSEQNMP